MVIHLHFRVSFALRIAAAFCSTFNIPACAQVASATPAASNAELAAVVSSAPAEKLRTPGIHNAGKVSDVLFRGAQPSAQGLAELKKLGVTTIVDLRGNRGPIERERAEAESLGMHFIDIPVPGMSPPSHAQVAQFLKLFDDPNQKIFVHCYFGEDRTGVMVAAYRIARQHWTAEQAASEMYSFGFHHRLYPGMKSYIQRFPATFAGDSVFASLRPPAAPR